MSAAKDRGGVATVLVALFLVSHLGGNQSNAAPGPHHDPVNTAESPVATREPVADTDNSLAQADVNEPDVAAPATPVQAPADDNGR